MISCFMVPNQLLIFPPYSPSNFSVPVWGFYFRVQKYTTSKLCSQNDRSVSTVSGDTVIAYTIDTNRYLQDGGRMSLEERIRYIRLRSCAPKCAGMSSADSVSASAMMADT